MVADILNARILIVDDLEANVRLLERMLVSAGYASVASTMEPLEVCELHRKNRYDLILLDLQLPGMDGFQVMEGLKEIEEGSYLPVLVITAQPDQKLRALQAGAKDFVSKLFDLAELMARVHNILEVRLLHGEATNYSKALVRKEAFLGLLNGSLVGLVAAIGMYMVASFQHLPTATILSIVVFLAMIGSCVISGVCGAIVPLILKRLGHDPVTASSIFLTTATDVASMVMLLGLAAVLVK